MSPRRSTAIRLLEVGEVSRDAGSAEDTPHEHEATPEFDGDAALDIASYAKDTEASPADRGDWSEVGSSGASGDVLPGLENRSADEVTLAEHLSGQIGAMAHDAREALIAARIVHELDEAGYLHTKLHALAEELGAPLAEVERALALVQSCDPTGVGARSLSECLALQAKEADRYDPCMARLIDHLDLAGGRRTIASAAAMRCRR